MAVQSAVACSEVKDGGLLVSLQLMECILVWFVVHSRLLSNLRIGWLQCLRSFRSVLRDRSAQTIAHAATLR